MLQSSNNGNDPIYYSDQQGYNRPFFSDISTPNSKHDHQEQPPPPLTPLSFFHLPSPCIPYDHLELQDYDIFLHNHDLLLHHHQQQQQPQSLTRSFASDTMVDFNINEDATNYKKSQHNNNNNNNTSLDHDQDQQRKQMMTMMPKKRSSKRDRHSKINTAQGPRDRRMRLSLKVAREFFDLQDKLGFDKASKTVEWLLHQSRQAIKKLSAGGGGGGGRGLLPPNNYSCTSTLPTKSASSTSECEVVSGIDEAAATKASISKTTKPSSSSRVNNKGIKKAKPSRRTALFHPLARESREKARARARERTEEKKQKEKKQLWVDQKIMDESKLCEESRNQELNPLSCWSSPFENTTTGDQESGNNNNNNTINPCLDMQLPLGSSPERDRLVLATTSENMGKWSPSSIIIHNHLYNTGIPQEHQIADLQSLYMQVMGGL